MEISLLLAQEISALFIMAAVGFLIVKLKLLSAKDSKVVSILTVYVFSPCVIINSFLIEFSEDKMSGLLLCFVAAALTQLIFTIVVWLIGRVYPFRRIEEASMLYTNAGHLTIPIVLGVMGEEWVFYASAYLVVFNLLIWTHGVMLIGKGKDMNVRKILLNPNIISCLLGIVLFAAQIRLPAVLETTLSGFARMVGPASMLVIGMLVANIKLIEAFKQSRVYIICFIRLILLPLIVIGIIKITGVSALHIYGKQILCIVLLAASAPVANAVTQIAQIYDREPDYAGLINGMSVIFCVVTMPVMVFIYDMII